MHTVNLRPSTQNRLSSRSAAETPERAAVIASAVQRPDQPWVLAGAAVVVLGSLFGVSAGFRARVQAERPPASAPPLVTPAPQKSAPPAAAAPLATPPAPAFALQDPAALLDLTPQPLPVQSPRFPAPHSGTLPGNGAVTLRPGGALPVPPPYTPPANAPHARPQEWEVPPTELLVRGYSLTGQPGADPRR